MIEKEQRPAHWRETRLLMAVVVTALGGAIFLLALTSGLLDAVTVLSFPLGFYATAQGVLIALVVVAYWFAGRQERLDRRHGAMEDM